MSSRGFICCSRYNLFIFCLLVQVTEREMLMSTLAEQTRSVTQLRLQLLNARARVAELEQQNQALRQLLRDAQLPGPAAR